MVVHGVARDQLLPFRVKTDPKVYRSLIVLSPEDMPDFRKLKTYKGSQGRATYAFLGLHSRRCLMGEFIICRKNEEANTPFSRFAGALM